MLPHSGLKWYLSQERLFLLVIRLLTFQPCTRQISRGPEDATAYSAPLSQRVSVSLHHLCQSFLFILIGERG